MTRAETVHSTTVAAVVQAADGVRFVVAGRWADEVVPALIGYIEQRCDDVLWPRAASDVRMLIEARQPHAAIAAYFEHVGARWDEEYLELHVLAQKLSMPLRIGTTLRR